jgi:tripartite-type tricarboxylate transporter receptor subunit TctC
MRLTRRIAGVAAGLLMAVTGHAQAQDWAPDGPVRLQIGFAAGGSTDSLGRMLAEVMKEQTGWNIIAENKTGGGGVAMFTAIANMPPRGQIVGLGVNMPLLVNLVNRAEQMQFDLDSFDYLGTVSKAQLALVASADAPFDDLEGMVEYAKEQGGIAVAFDAPPQKLLLDIVSRQSDVEISTVSTAGSAESMKLILGGQVQVGFGAGVQMQYLEAGTMKVIASANEERLDFAPDAPTFLDAGYGAYVEPVYFLATTAGTDPAAVAALSSAIDAAMQTEQMAEIVRNAATSEPENLGAEGTREMMQKGLDNVRVLFGK